MSSQSEGDDSATEHFIVMEDLTAGYSRPCICDLKIGARGRFFPSSCVLEFRMAELQFFLGRIR